MSGPQPVLRIDLASSEPVYRQITDGLRALLVGGAFTPGDQLPTVRQLAADLGVHHNTVAESYRSLAQEGWLDLGRRRGATVLDRRHDPPDRRAMTQLAHELRERCAKAVAEGVTPQDVASLLEDHACRLRRMGARAALPQTSRTGPDSAKPR
ncbi:MAG: GntR family transcriptional regulator [Phycisphaeraceae bacterium]|nr:GntR family transcriptional regulator [Phycisphaeraceae bacterium]